MITDSYALQSKRTFLLAGAEKWKCTYASLDMDNKQILSRILTWGWVTYYIPVHKQNDVNWTHCLKFKQYYACSNLVREPVWQISDSWFTTKKMQMDILRGKST